MWILPYNGQSMSNGNDWMFMVWLRTQIHFTCSTNIGGVALRILFSYLLSLRSHVWLLLIPSQKKSRLPVSVAKECIIYTDAVHTFSCLLQQFSKHIHEWYDIISLTHWKSQISLSDYFTSFSSVWCCHNSPSSDLV